MYNKNRLIIIAAIFITLYFSVFSYIRINALTESAKSVNHTTLVALELEKLIGNIKSAETAHRGYLLTHNVVFLKPFSENLKLYKKNIDNLKKLVDESPTQQTNLIAVSNLAQKRDVYMRKILEYDKVRKIDNEELLAGKAIMDNLHNQIDNMMKVESSHMSQRTAYYRNKIWIDAALLLIFCLMALPLLIFAYLRLNVSLKHTNQLKIKADEAILQKQIIESNANEMQRIFRNAPVALFILRGSNYIVEIANDKILEIWGKTIEEVLSLPILTAIPELAEQGLESLLKEVLQTGIPFHAKDIPTEIYRNGKLYKGYYDFIYSPLYDADSLVSGIMAVATEVTEQVAARQIIEESEKNTQKELVTARQLQKISTQLIKENNIDIFHNQLMEAAKTIMDADSASIHLCNSQNNELELHVWQGFHPDAAAFWTTINSDSANSCGKAYKEIRRVVITDVETSKFMAGSKDLFYYRLSGIRAVQSTPLVSRNGSFMGMISTYWKVVHHPLEKNLQLLDVLARQATDLIERKQTELKLLESATQFNAMADNIPNLAWMANASGYIFWYNKKWYDYTGTTLADMKGWGWQSVHDQEVLPEVLIKWQESIATGQPFGMTFPIKGADGKFRQFLTRVLPLKDSEGNIQQWFGTNTDITEQKEIQDLLSQREEKFRSLTQALPQLVWVTDASGKAEFVSKRWKEYSGVEPDGDEAWKEIVHPDDYDNINKEFNNSLATGVLYRTNVRLKSRNGEYRWHTVIGEPVSDKDNNIIKWVGAFTDVHHERTFLQQLEKIVMVRTTELNQKNVELQNLNKELESFAYISSHDLQEPLRKIQTFASRIVEREYDSLSENAKDNFNKMQGAAKRMQTLIADLLTYSSMDSKLRKFEATDLNLIIDDVKEDLSEEILAKNVTIEVTGFCTVDVIKFQFRQLMLNLIGNAIKYSHPQIPPYIKIKSSRSLGSKLNNEQLLPQKKYCHISISDNGIGFEKQYSEKIFEVFQRLHGKNEYQGTGIGLSIAKKIVDNHNGIITAASEPNEGATFDIYIPIINK